MLKRAHRRVPEALEVSCLPAARAKRERRASGEEYSAVCAAPFGDGETQPARDSE